MLAWIGQLGIDRDGPSQVGFGLLEVALISINDAAIVVGDRVIGRQRQRLVRVLESPIKLAEPDPGKSPVAKQCRRLRRIEVECPRQVVNGALVVALVQPKRAPEVPGIRQCKETARLPRLDRRTWPRSTRVLRSGALER